MEVITKETNSPHSAYIQFLHAHEEGHRICWKDANVLQIEPNTTRRKYKEYAHVSGRPSDQSSQPGHLSHLDSHYCSRSQKTTTLSREDYVRRLCFYLGTIQRICFFSYDFNSDSTLILTKIAVKQCMDIGARSHVYGVFLMILMFILTLEDDLCCAWFIYPILCSCWCPKIGIISIDCVQLSRLFPEGGDRNQSPKRCVLNRNWTMGNVRKHTHFRNMIHYSNFILLHIHNNEAYF
jgi:hypothetical protein